VAESLLSSSSAFFLIIVLYVLIFLSVIGFLPVGTFSKEFYIGVYGFDAVGEML
jgi:hypothetical protein